MNVRPPDRSGPGSILPESIAEARCGSLDALGQILEACRPYLLHLANQELTAELRAKAGASDLVQQTFLEAQKNFQQFQGRTEAELIAWLRCILLNNLFNFIRHYRTSKRQASREVVLDWTASDSFSDEPVAKTPSPSEHALADEQAELLEQALRQLPEDYRQVIVLRQQERRSFAEIGKLMERSAEAARKLWMRALERLKLKMEAPA